MVQESASAAQHSKKFSVDLVAVQSSLFAQNKDLPLSGKNSVKPHAFNKVVSTRSQSAIDSQSKTMADDSQSKSFRVQQKTSDDLELFKNRIRTKLNKAHSNGRSSSMLDAAILSLDKQHQQSS